MGRTEPPSWHQAPDPNPDYRYVLEPGKGHTIHVDYGVHWGNEKHNQWVRDLTRIYGSLYGAKMV